MKFQEIFLRAVLSLPTVKVWFNGPEIKGKGTKWTALRDLTDLIYARPDVVGLFCRVALD